MTDTPAEEVEETPDAPEEGTVTTWEPEPEAGDTPDEDISGEVEEPVVETPEEVVPEIQPFTVRAGGENYTVPGMMVAPEGAYIPKEHLPAVQRLIQRGRHHETSWPQELQRERMEVKRQEALRTISEAKALVYTQKMEAAFKDEASFLAFAENLQHNLQIVQMEVGTAEDKARMEALKQGLNLDNPYNELAGEDLQRAAAESLVQQYNDLIELPDIRSIIPDKAAEDAVFGLLMLNPARYFYPAPQDIPEIAVRKGQYVVDREVMAQDVRQLAGFRGPQMQVQKAKEETSARAKQINAAVQKAPKAPASKPSSAKPHRANTAEDWRRNLLRMAKDN